jgi:hypothetical protein
MNEQSETIRIQGIDGKWYDISRAIAEEAEARGEHWAFQFEETEEGVDVIVFSVPANE